MKNLLIILTIFSNLFFFRTENVDCASSGIYIKTINKNISLNEMIIIEGYGYSQRTIKSFIKRGVFLVSKKDTIKLKLQHIYKSNYSLTQAIFFPPKNLLPNTIYNIKIQNQTKNESYGLKKWNSEKKRDENKYLKTTDKIINITNINKIKYKFEKTNYIEYGCGPAVFADFKLIDSPEKDIFYKTELVDINTNKKSIYYLKSNKQKLSIGHGMCAGEFSFIKKHKYKIKFTPINTNGSLGQSSKWISFQNPYLNAKYSW